MRVIGRDIAGEIFDLSIEDERWVAPDDSRPLDLTSYWSLPGLADAHAHLAQDEMILEPGDPAAICRRAFACIENGVFLCVDKGWSDGTVLTLTSVPPSERPYLFCAGTMIAAPGGYFPDFAVEVDSDGLAEEVRRQAEGSLGWVKIVGDWPRRGVGPVAAYSVETLRRAVEVAHRAGAMVAIHTMAPEVPSWAVEAGVDSIEHGLFLTDADIDALGRRAGMWVPTVLRMEAVIQQLGADSSGGRLIGEGLSRVRDLLPSAIRQGVAVLAGSDLAMPHGEIASEAVALTRYGMDPVAAVAAVSGTAYDALGVDSGFAPGLPADLVAFSRPPTEDVTVLGQPSHVIRRGRVLRP